MHMRTIKVRVRILVEKDEHEFHAFCPELKGLHVFGATEEEAAENAKQGVTVYLDTLLKNNMPIPLGCVEDDKSFSFLSVLTKLTRSLMLKPRSQSRSRSFEAELQVA